MKFKDRKDFSNFNTFKSIKSKIYLTLDIHNDRKRNMTYF